MPSFELPADSDRPLTSLATADCSIVNGDSGPLIHRELDELDLT